MGLNRFRGGECVQFYSLLRDGSLVVGSVVGGGSFVVDVNSLVWLVRVWLIICVCLSGDHFIRG